MPLPFAVACVWVCWAEATGTGFAGVATSVCIAGAFGVGTVVGTWLAGSEVPVLDTFVPAAARAASDAASCRTMSGFVTGGALGWELMAAEPDWFAGVAFRALVFRRTAVTTLRGLGFCKICMDVVTGGLGARKTGALLPRIIGT